MHRCPVTSQSFFQSTPFSLIVVPLLIFFARILDVSMGTLRIIFVSKGLKYLAPVLGFFEAMVWVVAIGQVMQNLKSWETYIAYALGFATGNFVGIFLEERIAVGNLVVRIITRRNADELLVFLRGAGYGVTSSDAEGEAGPVKLLFLVCKRRDLKEIVRIVKRFNPRAFYTVEDVRFVEQAFLPPFTRGADATATLPPGSP